MFLFSSFSQIELNHSPGKRVWFFRIDHGTFQVLNSPQQCGSNSDQIKTTVMQALSSQQFPGKCWFCSGPHRELHIHIIEILFLSVRLCNRSLLKTDRFSFSRFSYCSANKPLDRHGWLLEYLLILTRTHQQVQGSDLLWIQELAFHWK